MSEVPEIFQTDEHLGKVMMVPAAVGSSSLVGIRGEPPHVWGNYFYFPDDTRVVNMWAENLQAAVPRFLSDGMVKIRLYDTKRGKFALIIDERLPESWLYNQFCFTGGWGPPLDVAQDMYSHYGDPTFQLEQFTNPPSYYAKRGGRYNIAKGYISYDDESRAAGQAYQESPRFKMEGFFAPLEVAG